jgi:hypothetical protein
MSLTYNIPKNSPTSSVRLYRFPYQGERLSDRMNLLLHSVNGDLKHVHAVLEATEGIAIEHLGGMSLLSIPPVEYQGFSAVYVLAPHITPYLVVNPVSVVAGTYYTIMVSHITLSASVGTVTIGTTVSLSISVSAIELTATHQDAAISATVTGETSIDVIEITAAVQEITISTQSAGIQSATISVTPIVLTPTVNTVDVSSGQEDHGGLGFGIGFRLLGT